MAGSVLQLRGASSTAAAVHTDEEGNTLCYNGPFQHLHAILVFRGLVFLPMSAVVLLGQRSLCAQRQRAALALAGSTCGGETAAKDAGMYF